MLVLPKIVSYNKLETTLFAQFEVPMSAFSCGKSIPFRFVFTKFVFLMCSSSNPLLKIFNLFEIPASSGLPPSKRP
jgi:hypothetical protein